jgi:hypothetical protein
VTETEKHAIVGRVLTEKKDAENHLALLRAEAKRLAQLFESLGKELKDDPATVRFERQAVNIIYSSRDQRLYKTEDIDGPTLAKLTAEIRDIMDKLESLTTQARELGF